MCRLPAALRGSRLPPSVRGLPRDLEEARGPRQVRHLHVAAQGEHREVCWCHQIGLFVNPEQKMVVAYDQT